MGTRIIGTGSYLPKEVITNFDLEKRIDTTDDWIRSRTGIGQRHIASKDESTSDLAAKAAVKALEMANVNPSEIDLIIVSTLTPDKLMPSTAAIVQKKINAEKAVAFDIEAACAGFVYALAIADQFIKTGFYKKILVIGSEVMSRFLNWDDRNTCVLFGDGAGAALLTAAESDDIGIQNIHLGTNGFVPEEWLDIESGGSAKQASLESITNKEHFIRMNGKEIFKFGSSILVKSTEEVLKSSNLTIKDVDYLIPHQANSRIIKSAARKLGINEDRFIVNIEKCANTSSASIPIALDEAVRNGKIKKNDTLVFTGFGAGLTWGSVLINW